MFNMTKIRASNASGRSFYANHLAADDYYSEHEKIVGHWHGKLSADFGLARSEVTSREFSLFQRNINPATGTCLTQRKVEGGPRFFDFQVAAPKSVSVMSLFDDRLREAHNHAVKLAMNELENLAAVRVRTGENSRTNNCENTGALIYAEFMHDTSRALDPQLHTHNVVCNVTRTQDGSYKALETLEMCRAIRYAGKVYHNALAQECRKLGYEIAPAHDKRGNVTWFELPCVSPEIMERFSKRRKQIEAAEEQFIAEHGRKPTLAENNELSNSTRSAKMLSSTREEVRKQQLSELSAEETAKLQAAVRQPVSVPELKRSEVIEKILETAACLFERESVLKQDKILAEVLSQNMGAMSLSEIKAAIQKIPELKQLGGEAANPYFSPQEVIEREQNAIRLVEDQRDIFAPVNPGFVAFEGEKSRAKQAEIIHGVLNSRDRFVLFRGVAGAGKTSTLQELCNGLKSGNVENIAVVAPTNSATEVLKQEGFEQSQTVASFLLSDRKPPEKSYIIIDESGLNSLREGYEILKLARKNNYRVLFVGDERQHTAVESGDFFRLLEDYSRIQKFALTEIHRQQQEEYRRGIFECSQGQFAEAFERFDKQGFIHEGKSYLDEAAQKFLETTKQGADISQTIMVAPTHAECDKLTDALRAKLKQSGLLQENVQTVEVFRSWNKPKAWLKKSENFQPGMSIIFIRNKKGIAKAGETDTVVAAVDGLVELASGRLLTLKTDAEFIDAGESRKIELAAGDLIQFRANRKDLKIYNGTLARVGKNGFVDLLDGAGNVRRSVCMPENYAAFDYGWVTTSHKSQGRTAQNVIVAAEKLDGIAFYVALSRGRLQVSLHCPEKALLKQHLLKYSGERLSVHDLIRDRKILPDMVLPLSEKTRQQKAKLLPDFRYKDLIERARRIGHEIRLIVTEPLTVRRMRQYRERLAAGNEPASLFGKIRQKFRKEEPEKESEKIEFKTRPRTGEMWKIFDSAWQLYEQNRREYHAVFGRGKFVLTERERMYVEHQKNLRDSRQAPAQLPEWVFDWQATAKAEAARTQREYAAVKLEQLWAAAESAWNQHLAERKAWWKNQAVQLLFNPWSQELAFEQEQKQRKAESLEPQEIPAELKNWKARAEKEYRKLEAEELEKRRFEDAWKGCDAKIANIELAWHQWWSSQKQSFAIPELGGLNEFRKNQKKRHANRQFPANLPESLANWKELAKQQYQKLEKERLKQLRFEKLWNEAKDGLSQIHSTSRNWWKNQPLQFEFPQWNEFDSFRSKQAQRKTQHLEPLPVPDSIRNWSAIRAYYRKLETAELTRKEALRQAALEKKRFEDAWKGCNAKIASIESAWQQWWSSQKQSFAVPELGGLNEFRKSQEKRHANGQYPANLPESLANWKQTAERLYQRYCADLKQKRDAELRQAWNHFEKIVQKYFRTRRPEFELNEVQQAFFSGVENLRKNSQMPPAIPVWLSDEPPLPEQLHAQNLWQIWDKYHVSPDDARQKPESPRQRAYEKVKGRIKAEVKEYYDSILDKRIDEMMQKKSRQKEDLEKLQSLFEQRYGKADGEAQFNAYVDSIMPEPTQEQMMELTKLAAEGFVDTLPEKMTQESAEKLLEDARLRQKEQEEYELLRQPQVAKACSPLVVLTGQTDLREQEAVLRKQIKALIAVNLLQPMQYKVWSAMSPQECADLICTVPEALREAIVQKVKNEYVPGQIPRIRRGYGMER